MEERKEKLEKLSRDVLMLSRNTLLVNLRFLDTALSQFEFFPIETSGLLTDGKYILYNPVHILKNYKRQRKFPSAIIFTSLCTAFSVICIWIPR